MASRENTSIAISVNRWVSRPYHCLLSRSSQHGRAGRDGMSVSSSVTLSFRKLEMMAHLSLFIIHDSLSLFMRVAEKLKRNPPVCEFCLLSRPSVNYIKKITKEGFGEKFHTKQTAELPTLFGEMIFFFFFLNQTLIIMVKIGLSTFF